MSATLDEKTRLGFLNGTPKADYWSRVAQLCRTIGLPEPVHVGCGVYVCATEITPEIAASIIADHHIPNNRRKKESAMARYGSDMESGSWSLTHQGLCFGSSLQLHDGQNRLYACIETSAPFKTMITFIDDKDAVINTDTGQKRSIPDASAFLGRKIDERTSAMVKCMAFGPTFVAAVSTTAVLEAADILRSAIQFIDLNFPSSIRRITIKPVLGAIGVASYHVDHKRLGEFCKILREGVIQDAVSDGAAGLLFRLLTSNSFAGGGNQLEAYAKTQNAIQLFERGQGVKKLLTAKTELFPLPMHIASRIRR